MEENREALLARIVIDPEIQGGRPVIRGTRVPVARIVGALSAGADFAEIREDYGLDDEDVRAALAYAAKAIEETEVHVLPAA
ncbi:MAG: DUF433 domain-containing protein [Armatimonadetes bacterium]|nr:DUF433 domain-containing protein [Armatimonadota bacterium]